MLIIIKIIITNKIIIIINIVLFIYLFFYEFLPDRYGSHNTLVLSPPPVVNCLPIIGQTECLWFQSRILFPERFWLGSVCQFINFHYISKLQSQAHSRWCFVISILIISSHIFFPLRHLLILATCLWTSNLILWHIYKAFSSSLWVRTGKVCQLE